MIPLQLESPACILTLRSATQEVKQRVAHDAVAKYHDREMVNVITGEVDMVVDTHTHRHAAWYNEVSSPASTLHVLVVNHAS